LALADQAIDLILTDDLFGLYELLNNTLVNTPDVRYLLVLDANGAVRAHTFGVGLPRGLIEANSVASTELWHARRLKTEEGTIFDVAVPLFEGRTGTLRLGMSTAAIEAAVNHHTSHLLGLMALSLVPVLAVTYLLGRALTQPLLKLVEITQAVARGEYNRQAPVEGRDEVAQLGRSFNAMTQALVRSQTALQERNNELATLYAVATATAHVDTIDSLVEAALTKCLEVMNLSSGWVFLSDASPDHHLVLRASRGLPPDMVEQLTGHLLSADMFNAPAELIEAIIAHNSEQRLYLVDNRDAPAMCHAVVPLRSRARLWGTMHLACCAPGCFTPTHLKLLTAIGRQVGIAIENAHLAEVQRQESFRRQLLDRVILAQEEERKRIARELHDELAQNLAVLIRDLEEITEPEPAGSLQVPARVQDTRTLARRILEQTRRMIFDLRPSALDDLGLLPAIRGYAQHHLELADINLQIAVSGQKYRLPTEVETTLFRIAQEAITNVVRHAHASKVVLQLCFAPTQITLIITDNGIGFNPEVILATDHDNRCFGLLGMRERAELLGGCLSIKAKPGAGVCVQAKIPLETV